MVRLSEAFNRQAREPRRRRPTAPHVASSRGASTHAPLAPSPPAARCVWLPRASCPPAGQVEERDEAQAALEASERRRRQMVEKEVARSWVVNFLENKDRRPEFLELMAKYVAPRPSPQTSGSAPRVFDRVGCSRMRVPWRDSWWEFSEEDLMRCGMAEELPPQPDLSPDATLTEAFAHFLEREEAAAPAPLSPTSPGARVAQIRAPESPRTPGAAGQRTSLWTG